MDEREQKFVGVGAYWHTQDTKKEVPTQDGKGGYPGDDGGGKFGMALSASSTGKGEVEEADLWGSAVLDECGGGGLLPVP